MLKNLTTTAVGGPAQHLVDARTDQQLISALVSAAAEQSPVLLIAGGSNLIISDEGFPGTVIRIATKGINIEEVNDSQARLQVAAGENWDAVVAHSLHAGLSGLEALSGIPGSAGATPVQNVGAYGADVSQYLESVLVYDRHRGEQLTLSNADLSFAYRDSLIKRTSVAGSPRYVVLKVSFLLTYDQLSAPVRYAELARRLGVQVGERVAASAVRAMVLELRRGKGMVYDAADLDSHSTGSFFTNPIVERQVLETLPENAPNYPVDDPQKVKLSAAWLIDQAGFAKGYGLARTNGHLLAGGRAALSTKHTLAITNRGGASAADILKIARAVRAGVHEKFGITLVNEPLLIGLQLDQ
ncbi:UDP-N-acetylmuramate dehydrogenase [Glutamicibacter uratoxydans]|uniref:UDP-N-acetylmuramate dehydrogenase n=1 Tax=Glutamicibacter uratoxydans TaxID=43667 RepID=UPI003D6E4E8A